MSHITTTTKCLRCERLVHVEVISAHPFYVDEFNNPACEPDRLHVTVRTPREA